MILGKCAEVWTELSKTSVNDTIKMPFQWHLWIFLIQIERGWSQPAQILSEMLKSLQKFLQATLELANTSMQNS